MVFRTHPVVIAKIPIDAIIMMRLKYVFIIPDFQIKIQKNQKKGYVVPYLFNFGL